MENGHLTRDDFPRAHGAEGFDIDSVGAHLAAVAAHVAALEARITALEVERDTLRRQLAEARETEPGPSGLPVPEPDPLENLDEPEPDPEPTPEPEPEPEPPAPASDEAEVAARLMATRLAMEGKSRETILMTLAAEHEIADPAGLVDDVLARLA